MHYATCMIGGWTEARGTRPFIGTLLLGVPDERGGLRFVGQTGAGLTDAEIGRLWTRLRTLRTRTCPFTSVPRTAGRAHWVKPRLAVDVKFTGWTADGKLRHPAYVRLLEEPRAIAV